MFRPLVLLNEWMNVKQWWNDTDRGKSELLAERPVTVRLCPPQLEINIDNVWRFNLYLTENSVFITKITWLILCSEIRAVYSENHIEHMNTAWEKAGGVYSYRCVCVCFVWRSISHSFLRLVPCYAGGRWPQYLEVSSVLSFCSCLANAASSTAISRCWARNILSALGFWLRPSAAKYRHVMRVT